MLPPIIIQLFPLIITSISAHESIFFLRGPAAAPQAHQELLLQPYQLARGWQLLQGLFRTQLNNWYQSQSHRRNGGYKNRRDVVSKNPEAVRAAPV